MASPWQVDLSSNCLGGYYENDGYDSDGDEKTKFVSEPSGVRAIADAIVRTSVTSINLASNNIGGYYPPEAQSADDFIATPEGPQAIADAIRVSPSVTSVRAFGNSWSSGERRG